ncbi:MAG: hypothetical protein WAM82_30905 [Thermoanaerobaculia bacterium]
MRRFGAVAVLGGLLLLGVGGSLSASDTPKAPRHARRKAVASKTSKPSDVKLDNLYVDSEIGQVFTVNLGRTDQPSVAGESASLGSVQVYQLSGGESDPPATEPVDPVDPDNPADPAAEEEAAPDQEMEAVPPDAAEAGEASEPAADDSSEEPAEEPAAAPQAAPPGAAQAPPPANPSAQPPAAKEAPKTPPPATAPQAPPPPPPPFR